MGIEKMKDELRQFLRVVVVTAVIERNSKYLMLKRGDNNRTNKNKWQPPEGKLEFGEDIDGALKREVKEETGLELDSYELKNVSSTVAHLGMPYGKVNVIRIIFKCKASGSVELSKDHSEFGWFELKEIENLEVIDGLDLNSLKL